MDFKRKVIYSFLWFSVSVFSQENVKHKVTSGESIYSIAHKYKVKQSAILKLNPKAHGTLPLNMILEIPVAKSNTKKVKESKVIKKPLEPKVEMIEHEVETKETLYSLSKKYSITIEQINQTNPGIEQQGLRVGERIKIPVLTTSEVQKEKKKKKEKRNTFQGDSEKINHDNANTVEILHEVLVKETKYGISKKYGITINELEALNPKAKTKLAIGDKLVIKTTAFYAEAAAQGNYSSKMGSSEGQRNEEQKDKEAIVNTTLNEDKEQLNIPATVTPNQIKIVEVKAQTEEDENCDELIISLEEVIPEQPITDVKPLSDENISKAEFLIAKASENIGARYRSGSTGNGGFDCSGLMFATFKNIDMTLPRSSREMARSAGVRIDKSKAQKGDLIFFATRGRGVGHVGMITDVDGDDIKFIHSSTSSGVMISSLKEPYYARRFVQINRVLLNDTFSDKEE